MNKILNNTSIDEKALHLNLFREKEEDIDAFSERVEKAFEHAFEITKDSFFESLDYLTSYRSKILFEITPKIGYELHHVSFDGVFLKLHDEENNEIESIEILNKEKFTIDFCNILKNNFGEYIGVKSFIEGSFKDEYLLAENIIPFNNLKHRFKYTTKASASNRLNDKNVIEMADFNNNFNKDETGNNNTLESVDAAIITVANSPYKYYVKDGLFIKGQVEQEDVFYNYVKWPLIISFNECKGFEFNSESFDYRIKDKVLIKQGDDKEKPYLLNQEGARLINQLLKLDNTYWGK
tara:strand:+ start:1419 stop:2300 length:882 start_codon:yes stop_codon:yes gene_type:complete